MAGPSWMHLFLLLCVFYTSYASSLNFYTLDVNSSANQDNDYSSIAFYPSPSSLLWIAYTHEDGSTAVSLIDMNSSSSSSSPEVIFTGTTNPFSTKCDDIFLVPLGNITNGDIPRVVIFCNGRYILGQSWISSVAACNNNSQPDCQKLNWIILNSHFPFPVSSFMFCQPRVCNPLSNIFSSGNSDTILVSSTFFNTSSYDTLGTAIFSLDINSGSLSLLQKLSPLSLCSPPAECSANTNGVWFDNMLQFAIVSQKIIYPDSFVLAYAKLDLKTGELSSLLTFPISSNYYNYNFAITSSTSGSSLGILQFQQTNSDPITFGINLDSWETIPSELFLFPSSMNFAEISHLKAFSFESSFPSLPFSVGPLLSSTDNNNNNFTVCEALYQQPETKTNPWKTIMNCVQGAPYYNSTIFHSNFNELNYVRLFSNDWGAPAAIFMEVLSDWIVD